LTPLLFDPRFVLVFNLRPIGIWLELPQIYPKIIEHGFLLRSPDLVLAGELLTLAEVQDLTRPYTRHIPATQDRDLLYIYLYKEKQGPVLRI
jgi:hypothetical protein